MLQSIRPSIHQLVCLSHACSSKTVHYRAMVTNSYYRILDVVKMATVELPLAWGVIFCRMIPCFRYINLLRNMH